MKVEKRLTKELKQLFPKEFLWGASVSSHQVDGGHFNQWTVWEQENAARFAKEAKDKWSTLPIWKYIDDEAKEPSSYISGKGVEHRKLFKQDFDLLKKLGLNTFRFSIEWSEIEPEPGVFNVRAIQHYKEYINELLRRDITPIVTLWHWTLPKWFADIGGFAVHGNITYWTRFVTKLADELDWSRIRYVLTINEPNTYMGMSYAIGEFPPGEKHYLKSLRVYYNLARAHRSAYKVLKARHPHLLISPAVQVNKVVPARPKHIVDRAMSWFEEYYYWWFYRRCKRFDFIGMNYYFTDIRRGFSLLAAQPEPHNDMGFFMDPAGLEWAILRASKKLKMPVLVAENGVADMRDIHREWWIIESIHAIAEARRKGADVIGYVHWSLLDNFEWQFGWLQKFGLVAVERRTMKRTVKKSALAYAQWLRY